MLKKTILSLLFFIFLCLKFIPASLDCEAQWVQCDSISSGVIFSMIVNENNVFAGSFYGVYLSTNNGMNWTQSGLNNRAVGSFAILGNRLFAGTLNYGIYYSSNNGSSWTQTSFNNKNAVTLMILGNNIYVGTDFNGIYQSTDNGTSWTPYGINTESVYSLLSSGSNFFAGTDNNGVYLSTNNGTNWSQTSLKNKTVFCLGLQGNNIFAGTDSGVYLSTNNGLSWVQTSLNNKAVWTLAISGNNIFAGTEDYGVFLSQNSGTSWLNKNQGFNINPSVNKLIIANNYIFAGTWGNSVWRRSYAETIGIQRISTEIPTGFSLKQNYPNPFNPSTNIRYQIANNSFVVLKVYNILGKEIATLVNKKLSAGTYEVKFDGTNLPSGVYYYRIETESYSEAKKMLLIK